MLCTRSLNSHMRAAAGRDVAEGIILKGNKVDAANLKQAIVAPDETTIA